MPSDVTAYTPSGRKVRVTQRGFEKVWKPKKGYTLQPPAKTASKSKTKAKAKNRSSKPAASTGQAAKPSDGTS